MSNPPIAVTPPPASRLSKSALCSLIFGILGCIPFIAGALAMLFALIGFIRTGKPGVKGRWMAVVGGILGLISVLIWVFSIGTVIALIYTTQGPADAAHTFVHDLSTMELPEFNTHYPQFAINDQAQMKELQDLIRNQGDFIDTTFTNRNITNGNAEVSGTAKFSKDTLQVTVELQKENGAWKVTNIEFKK